MHFLDTTSKIIRARLSPTTTWTNHYNWSYSDNSDTNSTSAPKQSSGTINSNSNVTILASPASNIVRVPTRFSFYNNNENESFFLIIEGYTGSDSYTYYANTLNGYDLLTWESGCGWQLTPQRPLLTTGYIKLEDQKSSGTHGGTATSGSWQTRTLNTEVTDSNGDCSLSSNQFTLAAGTYDIFATAPCWGGIGHQARLQNITDTSTTILGTSELANAGSGTSETNFSTVRGRFTIASSKAFELQHRVTTTSATYGHGVAASIGTEVYAVVELHKVA